MTEYTRTVDNITFKNNVLRDGSWLHVQLPNDPKVTFVVNWSDAEVISAHRWRASGERVVTAIAGDDGVERAWELPNLLLKRGRNERIPLKNKQWTDLRRVNLDVPRQRKASVLPPTPFTVRGKCAFLHANREHVIIIDREDLEKVKGLRWSVVNKGGPCDAPVLEVRAKLPTEENVKNSILLYRLLLGTPTGSNYTVSFLDNDRLNFRKSNLRIVPRGVSDDEYYSDRRHQSIRK